MTAVQPAKPARKVLRKSDERRAQITAAALRCLQRDGYASLTARKVAEEAGVALGHMTYHFRDMAEVLSEAYRLASRQLLEQTGADMGRSPGTPRSQLSAFLGAGFTPDFLRRDYLRMRIDFWSAALTATEIAATERELYDIYRARLSALLSTMAPQADLPQTLLTTDAIMALLDGLWLDWLRRGNQQAVANGLAACLQLADRLAA